MKRALLVAGLVAAAVAAVHRLQAAETATPVAASASIDLQTREGVALVKGQWRYSDTRIVEVDFTGPGADGQPTGAPVRTYDYTPKAGAAGFGV